MTTPLAPRRGDPNMVVGRGLAGRGVRARRTLPVGVELCRLAGPLVTRSEYESLGQLRRNGCSQIAHNSYVGASGSFDDFFNHSCTPNLVISEREGGLWFVTRRGVLAREELTWDYATVVSDHLSAFLCRCGAPTCRRWISTFDRLPASLRAGYLRDGAPSHVAASHHERWIVSRRVSRRVGSRNDR